MVNLRVQCIADGKRLYGTIPLIVRADFSNYFDSAGELKDWCQAKTPTEKAERDNVERAYKSAVNVMNHLLAEGFDYWHHISSKDLNQWISREYTSLSNFNLSYCKLLDTEWKRDLTTQEQFIKISIEQGDRKAQEFLRKEAVND